MHSTVRVPALLQHALILLDVRGVGDLGGSGPGGDGTDGVGGLGLDQPDDLLDLPRGSAFEGERPHNREKRLASRLGEGPPVVQRVRVL